MSKNLFSMLGLFFILLAACTATPTPLPTGISIAAPTPPPTGVSISAPTAPPLSPTQAASPTVNISTATDEPINTATATSSPTLIPTDTATPLPLSPLAIEYLRARTFPGSELKIEQTLTPGVNYNRYIASYLSDGFKIYGLLTIPTAPKPPTGFPIIIFNHGFIPPTVYRTTERYVAYVDAIARSGYIVFKSDYRGHGSSGGKATGGYGSPDYTIDVLNALASVKRLPEADVNRIGMWGHSMGGQVTLRAMVMDKEIKAGVIWSGVVGSYSNLISQWHAHPNGTPPFEGGPSDENNPASGASRRWREQLVNTYGSPQENPDFWASISPNSYVSDLGGPLQLHHDQQDHEVPYKFSQELVDEVTKAGGSAELFSYPGDDHNIANSFSLAMQRSIAFFDKYVKGN